MREIPMDSVSFPDLIVAVVVVVLLISGFLKKCNVLWYCNIKLGAKKKHLLPPGDMGWPFLGNMWSFFKSFKSQSPDTFIFNLVNRYGRTGIYKTHLFWSPAIIVCAPDTCKKVLADDEHFKQGYPESTMQLLRKSKSIDNMWSLEHKRMRRITSTPINGHEALSLHVGYIEDIVIHSLDKWASLNHPIELVNEMRKLTFKIIAHIFLGSDIQESFIELMEKHYFDFSEGLFFAVAINIPGFAFYKALKAKRALVKTLGLILNGRRSGKNIDHVQEKKTSIIDLLIESEDDKGKKLEDDDIIDLLLMFLFAGHETSAKGSTWATIYLHRNPEILRKAKEEQVEIIKKRPSTQTGLTLGEVRQMKYLSKVVDETLRMANLAFLLFREATADVNINGYVIPKGWKVLVSTRGIHMDPEIYTNPKDFNPLRFDNENRKGASFSFIPFGGGSMICPGADLAKLEISIFLHYFLLNYKIEQVDPNGPVVYLPVPKPANNCLAKIIKLP